MATIRQNIGGRYPLCMFGMPQAGTRPKFANIPGHLSEVDPVIGVTVPRKHLSRGCQLGWSARRRGTARLLRRAQNRLNVRSGRNHRRWLWLTGVYQPRPPRMTRWTQIPRPPHQPRGWRPRMVHAAHWLSAWTFTRSVRKRLLNWELGIGPEVLTETTMSRYEGKRLPRAKATKQLLPAFFHGPGVIHSLPRTPSREGRCWTGLIWRHHHYLSRPHPALQSGLFPVVADGEELQGGCHISESYR